MLNRFCARESARVCALGKGGGGQINTKYLDMQNKIETWFLKFFQLDRGKVVVGMF